MRLDASERTFTAGAGEPAVAVRADAFELLRALTGRRNAEQVRALDWSGDAEPYVDVFATYPMRESPLGE